MEAKVCSFMHIRNPSSELATRVCAQREQDRGEGGKLEEGGRTEGDRSVGQRARIWDTGKKRGMGSCMRVSRERSGVQ